VMTIADLIEQHIKNLLVSTATDMVIIRRQELAQMFDCVPSQINYVLQTRFTPEKGYVVESRRGGGGYIRIVRMMAPSRGEIIKDVILSIDRPLVQREVEEILEQLVELDVLDERTAVLLKALIKYECNDYNPEIANYVRASLLKITLLMELQSNFQG
jgi:transcriptional regulator CtsR